MVECEFSVEVEVVIGVEEIDFQPMLYRMWELTVLAKL